MLKVKCHCGANIEVKQAGIEVGGSYSLAKAVYPTSVACQWCDCVIYLRSMEISSNPGQIFVSVDRYVVKSKRESGAVLNVGECKKDGFC